MSGPMRGIVGAALAAALGLVAAGCGDDARQGVTVTLAKGHRADAAITAALTGDRVQVMLPSGRANFTVTKPRQRVPAEQADGRHDLVAADGTQLVGVSWSLDLGVYPNDLNTSIAAPADVMGRPKTVGLVIRAGGISVKIPIGDMVPDESHLSRPSWIAIPRGADPTLEVTYDGLTQSADPRAGTVAAGPAAALQSGLPWKHGEPAYAAGYPYLAGRGWAHGDRTWILVDTGTPGVTLDGVRGVRRHSDNADSFHVTCFLVRPRKHMELRWTSAKGRVHHDWIDATVTR